MSDEPLYKPEEPLFKAAPEVTWKYPSEKAKERTVRWLNHHSDIHGRYAGAIGGRFTYQITHTSLGTIYQIECGACCEVLDISEYEHW